MQLVRLMRQERGDSAGQADEAGGRREEIQLVRLMRQERGDSAGQADEAGGRRFSWSG